MRSLRAYVLIGAAMWSIGLLATWATVLTLHHEALQTVAVVHRYPHELMMIAILLMVTGFAVVRRGIAPLHDMRQRLAAVRTGAAQRVDGRFPTEVQPLVTDLNALLAHQERAVARAVAKAGDLAHGLKTPLAILTQEAERAAADGQPDLAAAIQEQIERMRRQIDYHLAHARAAASGATPGARCAIAASAEALARTLRRLYADRGVVIEVRVDPAHEVRCERADLDEMLGNLLDNACKWARTRVAIGSSPVSGGYAIVVEDDGPGIEPALREAVLQRGVRADEASPGSGLGLSIVRDLAGLYGGSVSLDAAAGGGLAARVTLPASNSATTQGPTK